MPIVVTFDLSSPRPRELNRLRGAFERLGWERLGNTVYRYPPLGERPEAEDWFNQVVPALMMLRAYSRFATTTGRGLVRFTIDAQTSIGFDQEEAVGMPPLPANEMDYADPSRSGEAMSQLRLENWIDGITWPYPDPPPEDEAAT